METLGVTQATWRSEGERGGTDCFPNGRNESGGETKRKLDTSRACIPMGAGPARGVRWRGRPVTGPGAYFGFLVRGHTEEGEKNAAVEAPLHVNNLGGRGHPLVELPGHIAQIGVQALLQGLVEDDLRQATGTASHCITGVLGPVDLSGLVAHQPWPGANTPANPTGPKRHK